MKSIDVSLADEIRDRIFAGDFAPNERITEASLCKQHSVSRTPVRLALRKLEQEGLIRKGGGRGYVAQNITVDDIRQAVQVRGHLEGLAARLMAERRVCEKETAPLIEAIEEMDQLLATGHLSRELVGRLHQANVKFHTTILRHCGNAYVAFSCNRISHLPMLRAGSMVFDQNALNGEAGLFRAKLGNSQHKVIYQAISKGEGSRAEAMMREHSNVAINYIEAFERNSTRLTVSDLVSFTAQESIYEAVEIGSRSEPVDSAD